MLKLFLTARKIMKVDEMIVEEEEEENKNKNLQTARVSRHSGLGLGADREIQKYLTSSCPPPPPECTV